MELKLTPRQLDVQTLADRMASEHLRPFWRELERSHAFPLTTLHTLAVHGLMGVNIPTELGGLGAGVVAYAAAVQRIAWGDPAVAVTMCVNNMVAEVVQQFGNERHQQFIPKLMSGASNSGSFCLSEAGSGSDAAAMQANARRTDSGFVLNGNKAWITSGQYAGAYLVWARVDGGGKDSISVFFVDKDTPGISFGSPEAKMGQHASNTVVVSFDDVELSADAVLGEVGQGFKVAMMALDGGRIGIASQAIGIADAMIDEARAVVDVPSNWSARLEAARMLVWRAAYLKEQKKPFTFEASMAKLHASETACAIGDAMLLATQSAGFDSQLLDKLVRDARVTRIYEGTSEVQRIVIAREMDKRAV